MNTNGAVGLQQPEPCHQSTRSVSAFCDDDRLSVNEEDQFFGQHCQPHFLPDIARQRPAQSGRTQHHRKALRQKREEHDVSIQLQMRLRHVLSSPHQLWLLPNPANYHRSTRSAALLPPSASAHPRNRRRQHARDFPLASYFSSETERSALSTSSHKKELCRKKRFCNKHSVTLFVSLLTLVIPQIQCHSVLCLTYISSDPSVNQIMAQDKLSLPSSHLSSTTQPLKSILYALMRCCSSSTCQFLHTKKTSRGSTCREQFSLSWTRPDPQVPLATCRPR